MKNVKSELKKIEASLQKIADVPYEQLQEEWKSQGVANDIDDFVKAAFKVLKTYQEITKKMHSHPEVNATQNNQMKHLYEVLIEAKKSTEEAISQWRKFRSVL